MNTLNPTAVKLAGRVSPVNRHRAFLSKPSFPPSLRFTTRFYLSAQIRASSQNPNPDNKPRKTPNPQFPTPLKTAIATAAAVAALVFSGFYLSRKPSVSPSSPTVETADRDSVSSDAEADRSIEEHLLSNPNDIDGLRTLMEVKIKTGKIPEAVEIIERLIDLEPDESNWPLMRAHLYANSGDMERAKNEFHELLKKEPLLVEAYHGLLTMVSQEESTLELKDIETRVEEALRVCKKENKDGDARNFKLLLAQTKVVGARYDEALSVYQELVKEEPRDFRPYLCQGIIYTMLRKTNEAEENFEKYRRLIPKGHPYTSYFDDNMTATKIFAQKVDRERTVSKS